MSSENVEAKHLSHRDKNIAYHVEWNFRQEAFIWKDGKPVHPNVYPLGTELRNWMRQKGTVWYFTSKDKALPYALTNPYSYDGSILSISYGQIINDCVAFSTGTDAIDTTQAEIKRIRLLRTAMGFADLINTVSKII